MIAQGIKRWLKNLFAWWPWGRTSAANYVQATSTTMQGTPQETLFLPTTEGPRAQPAQSGTTSVAIEPLEEEPRFEHGQHIAEEPSLPPKTSSENSAILESKLKAIHISQDMLSPTTEQRLEFLRYLIERGIVNEGDK